jgi:hypothetical protein
MCTAYVEIRSINAKGTWPHRGPDKGVFVQIVPEGEKPLRVLNRKVAKKRGIIIIDCGVGYGQRYTSPNSMYSKAVAKAEKIVDSINT